MTRCTAAVLCSLTVLLVPTRADAQTVSVDVVDAGTGAPVVGAVVYLSTDAGAVIARALTDEEGRALFFRRGTGLQRVRAEMIGMTSAETDLFEVRPGARVEQRLVLASSPIRLEGLSVEAGERCRAGPDQGLATARVWDEARKALTAAAITQEEELYRYTTMIYEQDLDRDSEVIRRSRQSRREAHMRTPFRSRAVEDLVEHGFVERSGATDLWFAPDAQALLSDPFLDTHCFGVRIGGERGETEGLVGLSFEPTAERSGVVEIAGTLWLDPASSELQWLEYRYVNVDPRVRLDEVGGRVEFRRLPDGGWIIPRWWIRMPRMGLQQNLRGDERRTYVAGFREAGGMVLEVQQPGRVLGHSFTGAMEGAVQDTLGRPLAGVEVELAGTDWSTTTDSAGSFSFYPLVEGVYELRLVEPALGRLGYPPVTMTRAVVNGETTLVDVSMPSSRVWLSRSCVDVPPLTEWAEVNREYPGPGIVYGWVLDAATDEPVAGAAVQVVTPTMDFLPGRAVGNRGRYAFGITLGGVDLNATEVVIREQAVGLQTTTNEQGFYRICHVPRQQPVSVDVAVDGVAAPTTEIRVPEAGALVEATVRVGGR